MHSVNVRGRDPLEGRERLTVLGMAVVGVVCLALWAGIVLAVRWLLHLTPEEALKLVAGVLLVVSAGVLGWALLGLEEETREEFDTDEAERR